MIGDGAPHRVLKISELSRAVAGQLIHISRGSTVSLARTCRYLEEPVLSVLWGQQSRVEALLEMLPEGVWNRRYRTRLSAEEVRSLDLSSEIPNAQIRLLQFTIVGDPSPEAWSRIQRYASWMRSVSMDYRESLGEEAVRQFRLNAPAGGWFPALRVLDWVIATHNHPYIDLLFSPLLEEVYIDAPPSWNTAGFIPTMLPALGSTISALPTSALRILSIGTARNACMHLRWWRHLEDPFSSLVLRCGPSLTRLSSPISLSDEAINHAIRLPSLRIWEVEGPPPSCSALSPPFVFPPLAEFGLWEPSAHGWLSLFQQLEDRASATQDVTPLCKVKESLTHLNVVHRSVAVVIDISLTSPIQMFRNLVSLRVRGNCYVDGEDQCTFKLDNDSVTKLAMALPQLTHLLLGYACSKNTCTTTIACLLPISVYCVGLDELEVHFNITNIINDLKSISIDPHFQEFLSLPRCRLRDLDVSDMPLFLDESEFGTVVDGMRDIFPSLQSVQGSMDIWCELSEKFRER